VDVEFHSDCGGLQQIISVQRRDSDELITGKSLRSWSRSAIRRVIGRVRPTEELPDQERETLVRSAFQQLKPRLRREGKNWVRAHQAEHPSEKFDRQLRTNPVANTYDIEVLVRVLLEVSRSDSRLRQEEKAFLEEIVPDAETIKRLASAPRITVAELAETSSVTVKETILMLAWAMAYADGHLDVDEMQRLNQLCRGFMLPQERVRELQMAAKLFLLDRHFQTLNGTVSKEAVKESFQQKAHDWGLDDTQVQKLRSWYPSELA
jgi:tellurite resistance protein